mmetsp:Transcript_63982/g.169382  ORF Transcript_63982/g.169382 Transcript_63982/m.169382 type:complete len:210 (-) Transcript_63982:298-927(-)
MPLSVKQIHLTRHHVGPPCAHRLPRSVACESVVLGHVPARARKRRRFRIASEDGFVFLGLLVHIVSGANIPSAFASFPLCLDSTVWNSGNASALHVLCGLKVALALAANTGGFDSKHHVVRVLPLIVPHVPIVISGCIKLARVCHLSAKRRRVHKWRLRIPRLLLQRRPLIFLLQPSRNTCFGAVHLHTLSSNFALHMQNPADKVGRLI